VCTGFTAGCAPCAWADAIGTVACADLTAACAERTELCAGLTGAVALPHAVELHSYCQWPRDEVIPQLLVLRLVLLFLLLACGLKDSRLKAWTGTS
jgi:hypothetical protein